jgi:hypothetical protein
LNPGTRQDEIFYEKSTFTGFLGEQARYIYRTFLFHEDKKIIQVVD